MSAHAYLVLRCDAAMPDNPGGTCLAEASWPLPVPNHTELRRLLHPQGWRRPRPGRDVCPDCWAAGIR